MKKLWVVQILAATVAAVVPTTAGAGARPSWWSYDRPATFEAVKSQVMVPMRDGTPIHCTLARPGNAGVAAPGRFPALIVSYTPYGAIQLPAATGGDYFAERGYATMTCDIRGTGLSGGAYTSLLSAQETQDNYELLDWMAAQPWSNGVLGQTGVSYGGMTSFRVAALQHPNLKAIAPEYSQDNLYLNDVYSGGIPTTPVTGNVWPTLAQGISGGRVPAALIYAEQNQHPTFDDYWKQIAIATKHDRIKIPTLQIAGWNDTLLPGGGPGNYRGLQAKADVPNYLVMGPWGHADQSVEPIGGQGYLLAWFDHWLMGLPDAPLPSAAVTSFEQPVDGGRGWEQLGDWPPPAGKTMRLAFADAGGIAAEADERSTASFTTNPEDTPQTTRADRELMFATAPLAEDFVLADRLVVRLRAAINAADANLKAQLYDAAPDGTTTFITDGELKASHRSSHEQPTAVEPGQVTDFPIELWPTHWRFKSGHRLQLRLSGGESTQYVPEPAPVTTTVSLGAGGTQLDVPIIGAIPQPLGGSPVVEPVSSLACAARAGFRSTQVTPSANRRKARLGFARRVPQGVDIDVFQASSGNRILRQRRVARFRNASRSVTWDGRTTTGRRIGDGVFVVRLRARGEGKRDWRRHTLVSRRGRFFARGTFYRPPSCGLLSSAKLERPVFGGSDRRPLRAAVRLSRPAAVTVAVRRGRRVVYRRAIGNLRAGQMHRVLFPKGGLAWRPGVYRVTITARSGRQSASTSLYSEFLIDPHEDVRVSAPGTSTPLWPGPRSRGPGR